MRTMSVNISRVFTIIVFITCVSVHALPISDNSEFELRILHTNDMHARFEETSEASSICSAKQSVEKKCYGGFARIATLIRQARKTNSNTLFLNAGDTYQGSIWFTVHKWKIVSKFMNILKPDAISLGNHEFDDGVKGLVPFINDANYPIVTANLDLSNEPTLNNSNLLKSKILKVNGIDIGVIGYLTPDTKDISMTENVIFLDEIKAIREEVEKLKSQGVKILIALGHSGFEMDKKIANEVNDIDLVIGGHTNTFLYTGKQPNLEIPEGLYPIEIKQANGRKVYVVQAYAYTKYLGDLNIKFNKDGEISSIRGNPILVNGTIEQAKDVLDELDKWREQINELKTKVIGHTKVLLNGNSKICRREECNLGNMIADAMIQHNALDFHSKNAWTDAAIAMINSGSIRSSITRDNDDKITRADVKEVLPFGNVLVKTNMTGAKIKEVLEFSVKDLIANDTSNLNGAFLQFSGLKVFYDLSKPYKSRVISVRVQCALCIVPTFSEINENENYNVLINDFIMKGGDNYSMLKELKFINLGDDIDEIVIHYLEKNSPVHPGIEKRINFINSEKESSSSSSIQFFTVLILLPLIKFIF
ncbi:protein 5NUC-like [Leptopilina boulardi]|uniref:protein 5NUC-like n=1 Tax=Leptopilina boulardi TaxID=63433 RepID=UPI0021F5CFDD|nr:protein 5NUC-like [Leptopilina boulardi]